jgi:2',3'-cyclic-nucleotide 2'-phosphodiesterase/3'-nucleotidase
MDTGKPTETLTGENLAYKICSEIDGVDVIISGHQHRSIAQKCCGKTVTQTAFNGMQLAVIEWDLDTNTSECYLLNADAPIDIDLMDAIAEKETRVQKWLDQPLGTIKNGPLLIDDLFQARLHKHPVVSFLARVMMDISGAQLSANALFNDSKGFSSQITMRDLVTTYVDPNTTVVLKISGLLLKQFLEKCAEYFAVVNDSITVSKDFVFPKPKHYNYDMVTGVEYTINASLPVGQRIVSLTYQGNTVQDTDEFTLAMTNYRASGGGNFHMVKECEIIKEIQTDFVECIAQYLKNHPELELDHTENIKVIK